MELLSRRKYSILMYQGWTNQAALAKGQRKRMCFSSSSAPHLEQNLLISGVYLPALMPVGRAFLISLHANVCILGAISFAFHICFNSSHELAVMIVGCGSPSSCKIRKQSLYALLVVNFHDGVSFQQRRSFPPS